ncbi:IclR family transcriptional regulator [Qingshengfaniella alkalisoli]|uniref:IclR family transcriptional regulator n=1 Tax=Qingshengfaniella alkalisoli TaxID=2599296 RepID=A0A5B8J157_9RHOB|nr:IclR family transcriptional regulator [Qingshengfaniella alkalisoli]QDY71503.1 IclR family transcriptional regulator [Qingshengfaniella alkalisoli]
MSDTESRYRAPALDKGLDILELLAGVESGLTQAEIGKRLGRSPNEFYRMLDRLVRREYVTRIDGDRFALTLKLFGLAQLHAPPRRLASYATPLMRELANDTCQANQLVVFDRGRAVVIAQQEAPGYWGISVRIGSHLSLLETGSGHVLLAFNSTEQRQMMLAESSADDGPEMITPEFERRLERIKDQGFESMPSAQTAGVFNLSAPILGSDGLAIAALTIPYIALVNHSDAPDMSKCIDLLTHTAQKLSDMAGDPAQRSEKD